MDHAVQLPTATPRPTPVPTARRISNGEVLLVLTGFHPNSKIFDFKKAGGGVTHSNIRSTDGNGNFSTRIIGLPSGEIVLTFGVVGSLGDLCVTVAPLARFCLTPTLWSNETNPVYTIGSHPGRVPGHLQRAGHVAVNGAGAVPAGVTGGVVHLS